MREIIIVNYKTILKGFLRILQMVKQCRLAVIYDSKSSLSIYTFVYRYIDKHDV